MNRIVVAFVLVAGMIPAMCLAQMDDAERIRIQGSQTLGDRVLPAIIEGWMRVAGFTRIQRRHAGSALEIAATRDGEPLVFEIEGKGTARGYSDLIDGNTDVVMAARTATAAELNAAWQLGKLDSPEQQYVVALDALATVVNPENPLASLSVGDLNRIVSGRVRDWKELGGKPGPIHLHVVDGGQADLVRQILRAGTVVRADARHHPDRDFLLAALAADAGGIGLVRVPGAIPGRVKVLAMSAGSAGARAIAPTSVNLRTEEYPLVRRLYLVGGPLMSAFGRSLANYAVSPEGQAIVERNGFLSLMPRLMAEPVPTNAPAEYRQLVQGATRVSTNLRFAENASLLDPRTAQDLPRLASLLRTAKEIILVSFVAPDPKLPFRALVTSQERADFAASQLQAAGLLPTRVRGFGGVLPLDGAPSRGGFGGSRDERVEIWVR
jgi:phosphate transport system substrate-binding protein